MKIKSRVLTSMTCIVMILFAACNMRLCKNETSDSQDSKQAQPNSFIWYDGGMLCEYEGFFDLTKTTKQEIQNAHSLVYSDEFIIKNSPHVGELKDIKKLNCNAIKNAYLDEKKRLSNMELPKNKVWEILRQEKLRELEEFYKLFKIKCEAFLTDNMEVLREFDKKDECLDFYATALINGGDDLLSAWEHLTKLQAAKNGYPENIWSRYHAQRNSENKFQYAKIELLGYGWNNCAVKHIYNFDRSKGWEEFRKLFTSITEIHCDEP